ncbi:MAG: InlB B-repeat-containing protein, partial [Bacilli bacterium]|nr:InlB B-repeat-containing protein [Bacilli bacterium]
GSSIITISTASDTNYNASNKATTNISISGDTYTISYNANNGTGAPASQSKSYGVGIKLSTSIPTRTGYTFTEWNTASDGSGTAYESGADFTNNANTVLYAQWRINKVYVGFNTNGGSITKNTDVYVADSNGNIAKNGSYKFHSISYGGTLGTNGLTNYNNTKYLYVEKTGSSVTSGQEWICMSGCTQANKVFNQTDQYAASDFCDASKSDCSVVLGVNWNDRYTVTYNNNGGSGCSSKTVTPGGIYGTMCVPTREGYTFVGWFDSGYKDSPLNYYADTYSDLKNAFGTNQDALYNHYLEYGKNEGRRISQYIASDKFTANANQTIYAGWKAGYLIEYNANGGSGTMNSTLATTGSSVTIKSNGFTRDGYLFEGWTTNSNGTDDGYGWTGWSGTWNYTSGNYGIANSKLVLYARWKTIKTYTISYNSNGGSGTMSSDTVSTGGTATIKNNTFTRSGYTFAGWTTNSDGTDDGHGWAEGWSGTWNYDNGQYGIANNALVLYARWNPKSYTINYNANGGSGTMSSSTVSSGSSVTIKNNAFTKKGYTFAGWTTNSNGTDDGYGWTAGKSYTWNYDNGQKGISNNTLKLYARWTANSYTISYNSNGGSGTMSSSTVSTGGSVTIKSNTFTRTGYKFVGWTTNSNGTDDGYGWTAGKSYTWNYDNGQLGVTNNSLVLYARWDNHFTVTYNDNGGSGCSSSSKTVTYGSAYGNLCTPTRSGYIFAGWYSSNYANAPWTYYYDKYKNNSTVASIGRNDKVGLYNNYLANSTRKFSRYTSSDTYSVNGNQTLVAGWLKFNYKREDAKYCSDGYFDTIGDAYNGCYGSTITILNDVTESSAYTFENYGAAMIGYSITINLNSHTLTIPSLVFDSLSGEAYILGPGKITYNSSSFSDTYLLNVKNGELIIDGGTYNSNNMTGVINLESTGAINLDDTKARLAIESNSSTVCSRGINSLSSDEIVIQAKTNGINIYGSCYGIDHAGVLRLYSYYPSGNNRGVEMSVIANLGYAILKRTGNVQVGSDTCDTRDNCTAAEIAEGRLGHYGYGTEMYPYLASYSATTNDEIFPVIYTSSDVAIWYTGGRLVSTKTGLSCANGGIYSTSDACHIYMAQNSISRPGIYTGIKYSTVSNEKNSHGDNINGFKAMLYK